MKALILSGLLISGSVSASTFDGVPVNCLQRAEKVMSRDKAMSLVSVCRDRKNPLKEFYTFSDGSSLTGFTASFLEGSCKLTEWWHGQDDQEQINETEWKENCLTQDDFRPVKDEARIKKISDVKGISAAQSYQLSNSEKLTSKEIAGVITKSIRHERYQARYSIVSHSTSSLSVKKALMELANPNGEARALKSSEVEKLNAWIEDFSIKEVFEFSMNLEQMGGSGIEQVLIFIPAEKYEPVLVIIRDVYQE